MYASDSKSKLLTRFQYHTRTDSVRQWHSLSQTINALCGCVCQLTQCNRHAPFVTTLVHRKYKQSGRFPSPSISYYSDKHAETVSVHKCEAAGDITRGRTLLVCILTLHTQAA